MTKCSLESLSDEEITEYVISKPSIRERIIERIREDVEDALQTTLVNAIKAANERPPVWWQWLFLLVAGALAGMGLGIVLAAKLGLGVASPPPPPPA